MRWTAPAVVASLRSKRLIPRQKAKQTAWQGLVKHDNYKLIQMVEHPTFFAEDERVDPIIEKMEGVAYECHQFNRHWPLKKAWSKPEKVVLGEKWTLAQGKEYIFYYGPTEEASLYRTGMAEALLEGRSTQASSQNALLPQYLPTP